MDVVLFLMVMVLIGAWLVSAGISEIKEYNTQMLALLGLIIFMFGGAFLALKGGIYLEQARRYEESCDRVIEEEYECILQFKGEQ